MPDKILLREVVEDDLPIFFDHQLNPEATSMASFPSRDWSSFIAHWSKILPDPHNTIRTVLFNGQVAGNIVSYQDAGRTLVGYWIGKEYWGRGIASQALSRFLGIVKARPLFAIVAKHNIASMRVLQKSGFSAVIDYDEKPQVEGQIEELLFMLEG